MHAIRRRVARFLPSAFAVLILAALAPAARAEAVTVFAAASLTDAVEEIARRYRERTGADVRLSFAASSTLARQIESGAPAHIFASADERWMDYLAERNLIAPATHRTPVGNRLVLIAPADDDTPPVTVAPGFDLAGLLGPDGRLAVADPDHTPAGTYARQALEHLGLWETAEPRLARSATVRAALALVERGEAPLGIVYATDAAIMPRVTVVGNVPEDSHAAIVYPFAIVTGQDTTDVRAFFDFITGDDGLAVLARHGFSPR